MTEKKKQSVANPPWNPMMLFGLMFVVTNLVSGILLGINWRRLGKPQWMLVTILTPILLIAIGIGIIIAGFTVLDSGGDFPATFVIGYAFIASVFGFLLGVAWIQNAAYQKWRETGDIEYVYDHEYNLQRAWMIGIGVSLGLIAVFGFAFATS